MFCLPNLASGEKLGKVVKRKLLKTMCLSMCFIVSAYRKDVSSGLNTLPCAGVRNDNPSMV